MPISEVIGEGAYGCVHKPSLICKNKKLSYKNKISKVMLTKEAIKELNEYSIISSVDKKNEFYVGMPTTCDVKNTPQTIKAIDKCKHIKKKYFKRSTIKHNISKMSLLVMNDGGMDLKSMASHFDKMHDTPDTVKKVKAFWVESHRLFRGLLVFKKYGIVHHDVKPQNIVYNMTNNRCNYIDFGHMRNIKHEIDKCKRSDNWIYDYAFWNYPFEIQFLNHNEYSHFVNKSDKEKEMFIIDFIKDIKSNTDTKFTTAFLIFMDYFLRNRSKVDEKAIYGRYITDFKNTILNHMKDYNTFLSRSIESIDVYGLGMSLQFMLAYTKRFMESEIVKSLDQCFLRMTSANLMERYTVKEAIDEFESALETADYIAFSDNKPVKFNSRTQSVEKSLQKIKSHNISINKLSKDQLLKGLHQY